VKQPESLDALITPLIDGNPQLQARANALVEAALDRATRILLHGDRGEQMAMIKTLLPAVFRASANTADSQVTAVQREMDDLKAEFRRQLFAPDKAAATVEEDNVREFKRIRQAGSHHGNA